MTTAATKHRKTNSDATLESMGSSTTERFKRGMSKVLRLTHRRDSKVADSGSDETLPVINPQITTTKQNTTESSTPYNPPQSTLQLPPESPRHLPGLGLGDDLEDGANEKPRVLTRKELELRKYFKSVAYAAAEGRPEAVAAIRHIGQFISLQHTIDYDFTHGRFKFSLHQMTPVEWEWVARVNIIKVLEIRVRDRRLPVDDMELILSHLFPEKASDVLRPVLFDLAMENLSEEKELEPGYPAKIAKMALTREHFHKGAKSWGRRDAMPRFASLPFVELPLTTGDGDDLEDPFVQCRRVKLLHVIEAAVYRRPDWRGVFYPDALGTLNNYYAAFAHQRETSSLPLPLPAHLAPYVRAWTFREERLLRAGYAVGQLLTSYLTGTMADYGILKVVRGSLVPLRGQPYWDSTDLASFLYARYEGTGLQIRQIPDIVVLHSQPASDIVNPADERKVLGTLQADALEFETEEKERLREIESNRKSFEKMVKAERSLGQRIKSRVGRVLRCLRIKKSEKTEGVGFVPY
ncbi:hypothetical protein BDV95DRAFT_672605 [Massariosphaeria phaeospora]|uniref:Uncharacterized protein n=1 Tax=Massariosphaeria phaeospora TaxID=100035 RepID=A0A7C8I6A7_9PLEO|nr:hypothetical protein BDV95DRAFT_672605 [Massariosphaeria phaeospora]